MKAEIFGNSANGPISPPEASRYAFSQFLFDSGRGILTRNGVPVAVGRRGLLILEALLAAQGRVITKEELIQAAWPGLVVEDSNLSVQVAALRRLLCSSSSSAAQIVSVPRTGYRLIADVAVLQPEGKAAEVGGGAGSVGRPAIAVLPFRCLGEEASRSYVADGITEDIIMALTRFRWFNVIGRNASFAWKGQTRNLNSAAETLGARYLLDGSLRWFQGALRVSGKLIDTRSGTCLWADHFDSDGTDAFAVQDRIALQVASAIEPELLKREGDSAVLRSHVGTVSGWNLVAEGAWNFHHVTRDGHLRARELFRQACQLDPDLVEGRFWLGRVSAGIVAYGWSQSPSEDLQEGLEAALASVQMDAKSPYAHYALAITSAYAEPYAFAIPAAEKAIALNPGFALGHLVLGMSCLHAALAKRAAESLDQGLRLNPFDPQNFVWYNLAALACLFDGRASEGLARAEASLKIRPLWRSSLEAAAACCFAMGETRIARQWADQFDRVPRLPGDALGPLWRRNPEWRRAVKELLDQRFANG